MAYVGGDIKEITVSHPNFGTVTLKPKANESNTYNLGGLRSDDEANGITGDGTAIRKMNNTRWFVEAVIANDMNINNEYEKVCGMAADPQEGTWTFTHINGTVYRGTGFPAGDLPLNVNDATFTLKATGGGNGTAGGLAKQV